jgi:signal transduction histidine kinase
MEALIMLFLPQCRNLTIFQMAIVDALLLLLVLFPILYFLFLKPLKSQILEHNKLQNMIFEIEEHEQTRIGQDLHDSLGQTLTGLAFKTKSMESRLMKDTPIQVEEVSQITKLINKTTEQMKMLSKQLLSIGTKEESLVMALRDLASDTEPMYGIPCNFKCTEHIPEFNKQSVVTHLYRIAQEAITNAIKHSNSKNIEIGISNKDNLIELTIKDDGQGMSKVSKDSDGIGLQIMNYRANAIGAVLDIQSEVNLGTSISCRFESNTNGN